MKIEKNSQVLIGIVVIIIVYFLLIAPKTTQEPRAGVVITCYDVDGNLLGQVDNTRESSIFSRGDLQTVYIEGDEIIQLLPGTASVKFNVTVENTGTMPINATYMGGLLEQT